MAWIDGDYKLISVDYGQSFQLYTVGDGYDEYHDLSTVDPVRTQYMKQELAAWTNAIVQDKTYTYTPPRDPPRIAAESVLFPTAWQTVDENNLSPATGGNNLAKFSAGSLNDGKVNPFDTSLYVRVAANDITDFQEYRVRAFLQFDTSTLSDLPITFAALDFDAHSLNNEVGTRIFAKRIIDPWSLTGLPAPTYTHSATGMVLNGHFIHQNLSPVDHTSSHSIDVTEIMQQWQQGLAPDLGFQLGCLSTNRNNGAGIKTTGEGQIQLRVTQGFGLGEFRGSRFDPAENGARLIWESATNQQYIIEYCRDLTCNEWGVITNVSSQGDLTQLLLNGPMFDSLSNAFLRVRMDY